MRYSESYCVDTLVTCVARVIECTATVSICSRDGERDLLRGAFDDTATGWLEMENMQGEVGFVPPAWVAPVPESAPVCPTHPHGNPTLTARQPAEVAEPAEPARSVSEDSKFGFDASVCMDPEPVPPRDVDAREIDPPAVPRRKQSLNAVPLPVRRRDALADG